MRIIAVPEHFSLPLMRLSAQRPEVALEMAPGGTGAMLEALRQGTADVAVVLTEGLVQAQQTGGDFAYLGVYVNSPLRWGIHLGAQSTLSEFPKTGTAHIAISRYLSGSHLMPQVLVQDRQLSVQAEYHIVQHLKGAVQHITEQSDTFFFWERFTTQAYVDQGIFKRVDEIVTPWPCFVFACRQAEAEQWQAQLHTYLPDLQAIITDFRAHKPVETLMQEFQLSAADAQEWLSTIDWLGEWQWKELEALVFQYLGRN